MPRLVEVLPAHPALAERIAERAASPDAVVRATALQVLRARGLGRSEVFAARLRDDDHRVRIEAIRGLVARDEADLVASAAGTAPARCGCRWRGASA